MTSGELDLFLSLSESFAKHYEKNKHSLLAKICGVFTVKSGTMGSIHIMLMENCLRYKNPSCLKYVFDLKGSVVDRKVKGKTKTTTTLKDVNFKMVAKRYKGLTLMNKTRSKKLANAL